MHAAYKRMVEERMREKMEKKTISMKNIPPKYKAADVKAELEAIIGKKMDKELEELLDLPEVLYRDQTKGGLAYANDMYLNAMSSIGLVFPFRVPTDLEAKVSKSDFALLFSESTSDGYLIVLNAKKRIAVRARVYSLFDEKANSWDDLRASLKKAFEVVEKTPDKNTIIACESGSLSNRYRLQE